MIDTRQASLLAGTALIMLGGVTLLRPAAPPAPVVVAPVAPPPAPARPVGQAVAVAARTIQRGEALDPSAIAVLTMEKPPAEGTADSPAPLVGRVAVERIAAGQTILPGMLTESPARAGLAPLVPEGTRGVTLRVAEDTGVAFLIRPGDRVDVVVSTRDVAEGATRADVPDLSRLVVQDLTVLAVGDLLDLGPPAGEGGQTRQQVQPQRTVTLAATPEQLLLLGLSRGDGGYTLALRNPEDRGAVEVPPVRRASLIGQDAAPAPAPASRPAATAPRPARTGPEIIRGPIGGSR